jgi:HK97 family phage major capsid protein
MNKLEIAEESLRAALDDVDAHEALHGADPSDPGQAERRNRLIRTAEKAGEAFEAAKDRETKIEAVRRAAQDPRNVEAGTAPMVNTRTTDPWANIGDGIVSRTASAADLASRAEAALEATSEIVSEGGDRIVDAMRAHPESAGIILARSNPAYRSAFEKVLRNPERGQHTFTSAEYEAFSAVEAARASMATTTGTAGYLIPLSLDPSSIIANAGSANPFRKISTVVQAPGNSHRIITSTGSNAQWLAENTAHADASPTFDKLDIALAKSSQWITGSFEVVQDGALLAQNIAAIAMDARDRIESDAFAIGSGSGAPYGVVTRVASVTASRVSPTTGGAFTAASVADIHKVLDALPARARQAPKTAWIANNAVYSLIRQMSPSANGGSFWTELGDALPQQLVGHPRYEASAMDSTITTGSEILLVGDFSKFVIVDHMAGASLEYVQNVVDGSGIPTGTRGWIYWSRVGSDVSDASQFRVLQL